MSDTAVMDPPAAELETDVTTESVSKPEVLSEHRYGQSQVTVMGKAATRKDGTPYTDKFLHIEKLYTNKEGKRAGTSYFNRNEAADLAMALDDARRAMRKSA